MKRDIRDLFKEEEDLRSLPKQHREEFLLKLKNCSRKKVKIADLIKIAAAVVIALTIGFSIYYNQLEQSQESQAIAEIEAIEAKYLKNIETEWQNFIAIANDKVLVTRFKKKLNELDVDYQKISTQFKENSNNIIVIEALVENLQTRLELLKDIQTHIKILNQKNEPNETTI